jgi:nucleotide-binding universal stress UspA family protein
MPGRITVLACVAYDRSGPGLVQLAGALCRASPASELYALHLVAPTERETFYMGQTPLEIGATTLAPLLERAAQQGVVVRPLSFVSSDPAHDIAEVARSRGVDLVLMGWHKPVIGETYLGGTVYRLLRETPADVGVLVDRGLGEISRVLVPYAGSPDDRAAMQLAGRLRDGIGAQVAILHVVRPGRSAASGPLGARTDARSVFGEELGGASLHLVEHASPIDAVLDECRKNYDLVVVGMDPDWGLRERLFSVQAERLLRECPSSLLVMRRGERAGHAP